MSYYNNDFFKNKNLALTQNACILMDLNKTQFYNNNNYEYNSNYNRNNYYPLTKKGGNQNYKDNYKRYDKSYNQYNNNINYKNNYKKFDNSTNQSRNNYSLPNNYHSKNSDRAESIKNAYSLFIYAKMNDSSLVGSRQEKYNQARDSWHKMNYNQKQCYHQLFRLMKENNHLSIKEFYDLYIDI